MKNRAFKVFFDMSTQGDLSVWETVAQTLAESSTMTTYDWSSFQKAWADDLTESQRRTQYSHVITRLSDSTLAIFDVTIPSMRIGNEIALALENDTPVLTLVNKQHQDPDSLFLQGIASSQLLIKSYADDVDLALQIQLFLKKYQSGVRKRLDVAIDTELYQFVSDEAHKNNVTKIEMVRRIFND